MIIRHVTLSLVLLLTTGCTGIRLNSREPVEGASYRITSSPYEPETEEECSQVGSAKCRYWSNPLRTVQSQCAEQVADQAEAVQANYIRVDEPNASAGGFNLSSPTAIFFRCEAPIVR